jgi:very-short-patch-repair endonuclease
VDLSLARRRALRKTSPDAEMILWIHLRAKRFAGFKFRRQHPCPPFILDFYCPRRRLAVELDGGQHFEDAATRYDERRTADLRDRRIRVLRFSNNPIFRELAAVLDAIFLELDSADPSP